MVTDQQAKESAAEQQAHAARTPSPPETVSEAQPMSVSAERVRQARELSERDRERGLER